MQGLTKRQREIVDYIESYLSEKRHSPSYRDIQSHFGFSSLGSVYNHIQSLKKKGILPEDTHRSRSLTLNSAFKGEEVEIPLSGRLKGGMPFETFPQISYLPFPTKMILSQYSCYALQIIGQELEEEWIREGDFLIVESKPFFEDGETLLAIVSGQTTFVKKGFHDSPYIRLESVNPQVQPLILREDHVQILGRVLSILRIYN